MFTIYDTDNEQYMQVEEPDPSVSYTYADYLQCKFEERLELFRGKIFKLSAPNTRHQAISRNLFVPIATYLNDKKCQTFSAPFDVRLPVKNRKKDNEVTTVVQPDICIVCDETKIDTRGCCGALDLIVEILSPGNSHKEVNLKYELYEEAGVKEYWIIYPEEESLAVFVLNENNRYDGAKLYAGKELIFSKAVPGLIIETKEIFTQ
ncbi:Uma2 family endonuclease [Terrimonas pollutisoli]|uniref:Uma2 family endonuclease n=1 Tax=Terrimonas pollutisoli TaxID=3034147 RepID=UPI0023EC1B49|nr:Uma2 family endonuclease [Terrimonas sp. H1YJ31]